MANTSYEKQLERVQAQLARKKEELRRLLRRQRAEKRKAEDKRMLARGKLLESLIDGADTLTDGEITDILTAALAPPAPPSIIMRIFLFCTGRCAKHAAGGKRDGKAQ